MARPPEEFYFDRAPTDGVDLRGPVREEVIADTAAARADPQLRLILGQRTLKLLDRMATAPTRDKYFIKLPDVANIDPVAYPGAEEGWYVDGITGNKLVQEDDGRWSMEAPHPKGAFTVGEMVELEAGLWGAGEALAQAAENGLLDRAQREAAIGVVEAADNLELRIMVMKWHPDQETRDRVMRAALEVLMDADAPRNPPHLTVVRKLKRKLLR